MPTLETTKGHCAGNECELLQSRVNALESTQDPDLAVDADTRIIGACILTNGCIVEKKSALTPVQMADYAEVALGRHEDEQLIRSMKQGGTN